MLSCDRYSLGGRDLQPSDPGESLCADNWAFFYTSWDCEECWENNYPVPQCRSSRCNLLPAYYLENIITHGDQQRTTDHLQMYCAQSEGRKYEGSWCSLSYMANLRDTNTAREEMGCSPGYHGTPNLTPDLDCI